MRPRPYIGITGFTDVAQVAGVLDLLPLRSNRLIMAGVLVSDKTLRGMPSRRYPQRYPHPVREKLPKIFLGNARLLNLVHFNTHEPSNLYQDLCLAQELAGPCCHGFQLNMAWPDPRQLGWYRERARFERKTIVLQCGPTALKEVNELPRKLAARLKEYSGLIDYVLIDPSGGTGTDFQVLSIVAYVRELFAEFPTLGVGIAGGLHGQNVVEQLDIPFRYFSRAGVSIDAEGKLRDPQTDKLSIEACREYLQRADTLAAQHTAAA
jgi:hypothetical protein